MKVSERQYEKIHCKVSILHKAFNIAESQEPIKMPYILKEYYRKQIILGYLDLESDVDCVANYHEEYEKTIIVINKYRCKQNLFKRLNFSLAHELGHIVLNHHKYFKEEKHIQSCEDEADEFAAQFLLPEQEFRECIFLIRNMDKLSNRFFVSKDVISIRQDSIEYMDRYYKCVEQYNNQNEMFDKILLGDYY